jgi:FKBP-type peptidyl-prolyl cis-trans isomerase 2
VLNAGPRRAPGKNSDTYHPRRHRNKKRQQRDGTDTAADDDDRPLHVFKFGKKNVIPGLEAGIATMLEGGKRAISVPAGVAYGAAGSKRVPANAVVWFEFELVLVAPGGGS